MKTLPNLKYTSSHEWIEFIDNNTARVGLTDFAQDSLGSLVFVNLPEVGDSIDADESFGDVESVKAVSEVLSPVSGIISAVNEELLDAPEMINEDPYAAWLVEIENIDGQTELLDAEGYAELCSREG